MKINGKDVSIVKETRVKLGLTQVQLAKELGVTKQQVCNWETGARKITKQTELALQTVKHNLLGV
jgi:DNA-binding transcriptional regulator YiaG